MNAYTYSIRIHSINPTTAAPVIETITGTMQAERYSAACTMAWQAINAQCASIRYDTVHEVGTSEFRVDLVEIVRGPGSQELQATIEDRHTSRETGIEYAIAVIEGERYPVLRYPEGRYWYFDVGEVVH